MSERSNFLNDPNNLALLLEQADPEDLDILVDYITDKGAGRIALDAEACQRLMSSKKLRSYPQEVRRLIEREILLFGGNTMANLYRDLRRDVSSGSFLDKVLPGARNELDYREVVQDVAKHLKVKVADGDEVIVMEDAVLRKIFESAFDRMTADEKKEVLKELKVANLSLLKPAASAAMIAAGRAGGFATFKIAVVIANAISKALLGRGLPFVAGPMIARTVSIALGPVAWVLTAMWTVADMASPAYRVTVPCIVQLAYMRQKALVAAYTKVCPKCTATNDRESKFCSDCGCALEEA